VGRTNRDREKRKERAAARMGAVEREDRSREKPPLDNLVLLWVLGCPRVR